MGVKICTSVFLLSYRRPATTSEGQVNRVLFSTGSWNTWYHGLLQGGRGCAHGYLRSNFSVRITVDVSLLAGVMGK
jgi:hypothetical protein